MKKLLILAALAACQSQPTDPGPTPQELYTMVCVDSVATTIPPYDCAHPPAGVEVVITIDNPFLP